MKGLTASDELTLLAPLLIVIIPCLMAHLFS
jgi:hypothetical protein